MRRRLVRVLTVPMGIWLGACQALDEGGGPLAQGGNGGRPIADEPPVGDPDQERPPVTSGESIDPPGGEMEGSSSPPVALDAGAGVDAGPQGPEGAVDAGALADAGNPGDAGPAPLDPSLARLDALSSRLAVLGERTIGFWIEHGPDATFGGFHGTLDRLGNPTAPDNKGLVQQARQLWTLSTWYERRDPSPDIEALAKSQYDFLVEHFVDAADGAFVLTVSRDGRRVVDARKQLYAESFALYALATYGRVFDVPEATELALARFESIDVSRHDAVFGGYDQRSDPGFKSPGAEKDTNTHLHLMEAFTALYEASGDELVGERLEEVTELIADTLRQSSNYVHSEFLLDWTPFGAPLVSYGHDLETSWLLLEAARVLGRTDDPALLAAAQGIAENSATRGFDAVRGGYFETGAPGATPADLDKVWWVQFEAVAGLWWSYALSADTARLDQLERTLSWIEATEDAPIGEWFAITNADGSASGSDYKADEWKESYHPVRSLVFVEDWIDAERALRAR
jgi:mannobiose 2-epimerase